MSVTTSQLSRSSVTAEETAPRRHLSVIEGGGGSDPRQLPLPLTWQVAPGVPAHPSTPVAAVSLDDAMPDPAGWAPQIARAIVEVAHGERPPAQLSKWVTKSQLSALAARGRSFARHPAARSQGSTSRLRRIRGVRCCHVGPGIVEASAVIVGAQRSSAIAFRLQAYRGRWVVTAVEMR
jgi:hypothetical protein